MGSPRSFLVACRAKRGRRRTTAPSTAWIGRASKRRRRSPAPKRRRPIASRPTGPRDRRSSASSLPAHRRETRRKRLSPPRRLKETPSFRRGPRGSVVAKGGAVAQRHMDRLTSFDTSFLTNERSNGHMAIGAVLVCGGAPPSPEDFEAHIRSRLHLLPRLRQRLAFPPLRLGTPFWVDDARFDLHEHLRRVTLPFPGEDSQFHELVGEVLSPPLDRSRPLWELVLVDGFAEERFAVVYKTHHAMADGFSAVDIGALLFDPEPNPVPSREEERW